MKGFILTLLVCFLPDFSGAIHLYAETPRSQPNATYVCDYAADPDEDPNAVTWIARDAQGSWLSVMLRRNGSAAWAQNVTGHFAKRNSSMVVSQYYLLDNSLSNLCCSYRHQERSRFSCTDAYGSTCHEPGRELTLHLSPLLGTGHEAVTWVFRGMPVATVHRPWGNVTWHCPPMICFVEPRPYSLLIFNFSAATEGHYLALVHSGPAALFQLFYPKTCFVNVAHPPLAAAPPNYPAFIQERPLAVTVLAIFLLCTGWLALLATVCPPLLGRVRRLICAPPPYTPLQ